MPKGKSPNYWVKPRKDGRWEVEREGAERAAGVFDTQRAANDRARDLAEKSGGERITQRRDGTIGSKDSYGDDPKTRVDKEH